MKSLKDYSLNIAEKDYHDYPAWSYSMIAKYAKDGFGALATIHDKTAPTPSMEFGSLFDSILTKGKATLDEYVVDETSAEIPPAEKSVFDTLLAMGATEPYDSLDPALLDKAINACDTFCSKYKKLETRMSKLDDTSRYYELRRTGKKVVSKEDWTDAMEMYRAFRNNSYLKNLFGTKNTDNKEFIYQAQFLVDYPLPSGKIVKVKIMPDLIVVDHDKKTIQLVDLKTSAMPAYDFWENFLKYRYDIQAQEYSDVMAALISNIEEYCDYSILPYLFTDISRTDKQPVTWIYDQTDFSQAEGFTYTKGDKTYSYKHWTVLLDEIISYEESQATVPYYITTEGPNDLLSVLGR